jgi:hypothetical protein
MFFLIIDIAYFIFLFLCLRAYLFLVALMVLILSYACHLALFRNDKPRDFTFLCILDLAEELLAVAVYEKYNLWMTFVIWADRIRE